MFVYRNSRSREALVEGKDSKKLLDAKSLEMSKQEAQSLQMERKNIEKVCLQPKEDSSEDRPT